MVTDRAAQTREVMVHLRRAEAARVVIARAVTSKADVAATKAVMVLWTAAHRITAITVVPTPAKTLQIMAVARASKADAATRTRAVTRHTAATATVIRKANINQI